MALPDDALSRLMVERSARPIAVSDPERPVWGHTVTALSRFWIGDFEACLRHAEFAAHAARDPLERVLAIGAFGLAEAGMPAAHGRADWSLALELIAAHADGSRLWSFARYLVAEAALDGARLDVAAAVLAGGDWHAAWTGHPFEVMQRATAVRVAAFTGRIDEALASFDGLGESARGYGIVGVIGALGVLLTGNADRPEETQDQIDALVAIGVAPRDFVGRGVYLLASYGAVSLGDVPQAAALFLRAGDATDLDRLTIIDRAIGLELLTHAALAAGDVDAARSWQEVSVPLHDHPIGGPPCDRLRSRVALAEGDPQAAIAHAERAISAARAQNRGIEAAEGTILLARAKIAAQEVAEASRELRRTVAESDTAGHHAMRRSARQVLRTAGRRLPPMNAGGWAVLSAREREIADLVLAGHEHVAIARSLYLSPATVRVHLSRVLCAFGVSSRIGLLAVAGPSGGDSWTPPRPLTARQSEVVALVAKAYDNAEIAATLEISIKAVEKHVGEALRRWDAASRFDLARLWLIQQRPS